MIPARPMTLALATASRGTVVLTHRFQRQRQPHSTAAASPSRGSADKLPVAVGHDPDRELLRLEEEYSTLKVNWFPGHMVKATKVIREKLKQVDMVFEVRDARIPFTSANEDLDKIVGPSKARLIILNKADLSNQALEQRVLQRFREQGKTAVYACGRTGTNVHKLLAWARERGARRGGFATTGAVAMVVGMPNVGKSSLVNLLRGKAVSRGRGSRRGGGGAGEGAKQVARVGAMPGVTRQVSAFRIASNPPLYLVDTPGVMVPRVERVTAGLFLALTRAVPDSAVPPDILVSFMLRIVRSRRLAGAQKSLESPSGLGSSAPAAATRSPRQQQQQHRRSKAIAAWLSAQEARSSPGTAFTISPFSRDSGVTASEGKVDKRPTSGQDGRSEDGLPCDGGTRAAAKRQEYQEEGDDDMDALLEAVERESGAEGKPAPEARRICCRFLLDAFRDGQFGRITLDSVPRIRRRKEREAGMVSPECPSQAGWAARVTAERSEEGGTRAWEDSGRSAGRGHPASTDCGLTERLVRDWSSPDAWERPGAER